MKMFNFDLTPTEQEILIRLCYFKNKEDYPLKAIKNDKYSINDIRKGNNKRRGYRKIHTPKLVCDNGWLVYELIENVEHIVKNNTFYGYKNSEKKLYDEKKRCTFLKNSLAEKKDIIELNDFLYLDNRGVERKERVYRIKHTKKAELFVLKSFMNKSLYDDYLISDYFKSQESLTNKLINIIYCKINIVLNKKVELHIVDDFVLAYLNENFFNSYYSSKDDIVNIYGSFLITEIFKTDQSNPIKSKLRESLNVVQDYTIKMMTFKDNDAFILIDNIFHAILSFAVTDEQIKKYEKKNPNDEFSMCVFTDEDINELINSRGENYKILEKKLLNFRKKTIKKNKRRQLV